MNIFNKIFPKKKTKENIEAHKVVEIKAGEAQDVLKVIQCKMEEVAREIDQERKRTNREMATKVKKIRDVAHQIAIVTGGLS